MTAGYGEGELLFEVFEVVLLMLGVLSWVLLFGVVLWEARVLLEGAGVLLGGAGVLLIGVLLLDAIWNSKKCPYLFECQISYIYNQEKYDNINWYIVYIKKKMKVQLSY